MPVCILSQLTHKMLLYSYSLTHSLHFYFCSYFINSDTHTQHPQQPYTEHSHTHIFLMHMHTATSPALSQSYTGHYRTLTYAHVSKLLHPHTTSSASLHAWQCQGPLVVLRSGSHAYLGGHCGRGEPQHIAGYWDPTWRKVHTHNTHNTQHTAHTRTTAQW